MKNSILTACIHKSISSNHKHPETGNGYHHFTYVVQNNQIIGRGVNRGGGCTPLYGYKSHQKLHAENTAYFKVRGILEHNKAFEIVNIRLTKQGGLRISKPCDCCIRFLSGLGCYTAWFSTGLVNYPWAKISLRS